MHNVADSSSDNDHLATISLAHTYNTTQTPVREIGIAFMGREQQSTTSVILSYHFLVTVNALVAFRKSVLVR